MAEACFLPIHRAATVDFRNFSRPARGTMEDRPGGLGLRFEGKRRGETGQVRITFTRDAD